MWPKKIKNEELGNDVTEALCISSDSDVSLCFLVSEFPAPECLQTDSGCMCVSALSAVVCFAILRKACWSASGTQISSKEGRDMLQQQRRSSPARRSGTPASERLCSAVSLKRQCYVD